MSKSVYAIALALLTGATTAQAAGRDHIEIVGSSTVFPFATVVAERFGQTGEFKTPKIEATGSGGGMKLFCNGAGVNTPDISNSSRRIKQSEFDNCQANGVVDIIEVLIGFDGIAIANSVEAEQLTLSLSDLYLGLAKDIPNPDGSKTFVPNPYTRWSEVNEALPASKIEVLGPPPTSGTRDAFAELVLEGGCKQVDWVKEMKSSDKNAYKARCHSIREDGHYVEAGENDNLIVQKLSANSNALGIFGYSFLEENEDLVQGSVVGGYEPTFESIADGSYPVSRPLYFYVKKAHMGQIPGLEEFLAEFTHDDTWGEEGYLSDKGMIPLSEEKRREISDAVANAQPLVMP